MMDIGKLAKSYLFVGVLVAALWPVMLGMATNVNVYEFLFIENVIAVVVSLLLVAALKKIDALKEIFKDKRTLGIIGLVGLLNYVVPDFGMLYAEHFISADLASIIFRTYPILMLLFLPFITKERITKYQLLALSIAFTGVLVVLYPNSAITFSAQGAFGIALVFVVALANAAALAIVKRHVHETESALFVYNLIGFVVYTSLFVANGMPFQSIDTRGWVAILFAGIVYSVLSAYGLYYVLKRLKATMITNLFYFAPFLTFLLANVLLGETISVLYVISAGLIAAGVLIQKLDKKAGTYASSKIGLRQAQIFDMTGIFVNSQDKEIVDLIKSGGRVLATKINNRYREHLKGFTDETKVPRLITREGGRFIREWDFIEEVLGKAGDDLVLLVAGKETECEEFIDSFFAKAETGSS